MKQVGRLLATVCIATVALALATAACGPVDEELEADETVGESTQALRLDCNFPNCLWCKDNYIGTDGCKYVIQSGDCHTQTCTYDSTGPAVGCNQPGVVVLPGTLYQCVSLAQTSESGSSSSTGGSGGSSASASSASSGSGGD